MSLPGFVDCHSHVVPSGDDGASTIGEGIALCRQAARHGTAVLFATPHIWPELPLTDRREEAIRHAFEAVARQAALELRLGYELTPTAALLDEDPRRYTLEGTDRVLVEVPFDGPLDLLYLVAEHIEEAGLGLVIAHPERTEAVRADPRLAEELAERGWAVQVNGSSLLGRHGPTAAAVAWDLLEGRKVALVASDGHRETRPACLDEAFTEASRRLAPEQALGLFDGSALGLARARPPPRRVAATGG